MTSELRARNQSQQLYVSALSAAWRNGVQLHDPSVWLLRDPEMEEKMLRDADILHAVGYRRHLIAGRQWQVVPSEEGSPKSELAVAIGKYLLGKIKHFTGARMQLARAFLSGSRFARIHGETKSMTIGDGKRRVWWFPTRLEDRDKRGYRIVPEREDEKIKAHWQRWDVARADWVNETTLDAINTIRHVYQDDEATLGHGRGLRDALGWWWYAKEHVFSESLQAVERFAQGILTAKVDGARDAATGLPNNALIEAWKDVLQDMRSKHVLVYDASDQVEHVQMDGAGWELLSSIRAELRTTIMTLVLGANLTTSASEGGSYALAEVQENSTEALIQFDRETLEETLTDDLVGCIWWHNWSNLVELGIAHEPPRFSITQEKRQDPLERVQVANVLHGMGIPLAASEVYEQSGFRQPEDGEEVIEGAVAPMPNMMPGDPNAEPLPSSIFRKGRK